MIAPEWVERVKAAMPELPGAMAERFVRDDGLPAYDAAMMTQSLAFARYYEAARDACKQPKLVANWLMGEVSKRLNATGKAIDEVAVSASTLAKLISRIIDGTVSNYGARTAFDLLWAADDAFASAVRRLAINASIVETDRDDQASKQMSDTGALEAIVDQVLAANPKSIDEFKAGKDKAFNALVGQVMKASQGKANPAQVNELLKKKLVR